MAHPKSPVLEVHWNALRAHSTDLTSMVDGWSHSIKTPSGLGEMTSVDKQAFSHAVPEMPSDYELAMLTFKSNCDKITDSLLEAAAALKRVSVNYGRAEGETTTDIKDIH